MRKNKEQMEQTDNNQENVTQTQMILPVDGLYALIKR